MGCGNGLGEEADHLQQGMMAMLGDSATIGFGTELCENKMEHDYQPGTSRDTADPRNQQVESESKFEENIK